MYAVTKEERMDPRYQKLVMVKLMRNEFRTPNLAGQVLRLFDTCNSGPTKRTIHRNKRIAAGMTRLFAL